MCSSQSLALRVPPDPRAVREAVEALQARALPRDWVRSRLLARMQRDRQGFIDFVQSIIGEEGGGEPFAAKFNQLLRNNRLERWLSMRDFATETWKAVEGK